MKTPALSPRRSPALILLLMTFLPGLGAEILHSPTWGFSLDLPEGFEYQGGDGKDRFSFYSPEGIILDLAAYPAAAYTSVGGMAADIQRRLNSSSDMTLFDYHGSQAALLELSLTLPSAPQSPGGPVSGWGLCLELAPVAGEAGPSRPKLVALAFGPRENPSLNQLYLSALDSIAPTPEDTLRPGPITAFAWPRGELRETPLAYSASRALMGQGDAAAAAALVQREYAILAYYAETPLWREAWARFYRFIFRDACGRLEDAARALREEWIGGLPSASGSLETPAGPLRSSEIPGKALAWVQNFNYERNFEGPDFVDLVSAALEGRGDCDSRALLWALILEQADIHAAIMVSREYSHAMGLADLDGAGARFDFAGKHWLVAETTAPVALGQINAETADPALWLGIELH
ncbi:MAG: hypothetical protein LBQ35_01410 [Spirochaetaceae bacterium]|jgi:hypothetical protein|nr:hypothetical protein [Spirochaetaceae bacterium]